MQAGGRIKLYPGLSSIDKGERMKRVLIAGEKDKTINYENAMRGLGVFVCTSLHVPDISCFDGLILPGGGDIDPKLFGQFNRGTRFLIRRWTGCSLPYCRRLFWIKSLCLEFAKGCSLLTFILAEI